MPLLGTTTSLIPTNATDADFRAWGSAFAAKLLAAGFVKASDTGQIDWVTVARAGVVSTAAGYEIWKFNDALQATVPVYFKVEYGAGATNINNPGLWFTFGSGSNGTGTLTGVLSSRLHIYSTALTVLCTCYWSGDTNRFAAALFIAGTGVTNSNTMLVSFERTVDGNGAPTSEGVLIILKAGLTTGNIWQQVAWSCTTGALAAVELDLGTVMPPTGTGTTGLSIAVYPIFFQKGVFLNPGLNLLTYFQDAMAAGVPFVMTLYGAARTFMPIGPHMAGTSAGSTAWLSICKRLISGASQPSVMMRYDT
jgi:hypothetical protein